MSHDGVCKWFDACPLRKFHEAGKLNERWMIQHCWGNYASCVRYQMEEAGRYHPGHMLPDGTLDEGLK